MATVTNWIDHLSAAEVKGAIYPGVGTEGILVIALLVIWIGWHVITGAAVITCHPIQITRRAITKMPSVPTPG